MTFPTFEVGYNLNDKVTVCASYLSHDSRIKRLTQYEKKKYKEVPEFDSFDQAKMYEGNKFSLSLFSDYTFFGIKYIHSSQGELILKSDFLIGYRFGETSVIRYVIENSTWPKGFEVISTIQSSNSPGFKYAFSPKVTLWNFLFLEISVGSYFFTNWPSFQPFGNFQVGVTL